MQDDKSEKKTLLEILNFLPTLVSDIKIAGEKMDTKEKLDNEQYSRRLYVRAIFAMIEGVIYGMKMALFGISLNLEVFKNVKRLNGPDLFVLRGLTYDLNKKGEVYKKEKYFRIQDDLKFSVKSFNTVLGASINLGVGTQAWTNFDRIVKIRNGVTHPKNSADLNISDEDWECIRSVSSWFYNIFAEMLLALQKFSKNQKCSGESFGVST